MFRHDATPDAFAETFGAVLKRLRQARHVRQIDLATEVSVDHSLVSRWESGAVLPDSRTVWSVCSALRLADGELHEIEYAWRRDRSVMETDRFGRLVAETSLDEVESARVSIDCVRALRRAGQPRTAMRLSARDAQLTLDRLRSSPWGAEHETALVSVAELLLEECKAGLDYLPRDVVRDGGLSRALGHQELIVATTRSGRARALHDVAREGVAYVGGDVGSASGLSRSLLGNLDLLPAEWLPEVVRASAINAGRLGDEPALADAERNFADLLESGSAVTPGVRTFVLEGLSRGMAAIRPDRAVELVGEAWDTREEGGDSESASRLRFVQLARTQAEVELSAGARANLSDTLATAEKAVTISQDEGYDRYVGQLETLIQRLNR